MDDVGTQERPGYPADNVRALHAGWGIRAKDRVAEDLQISFFLSSFRRVDCAVALGVALLAFGLL